MSNLSEIKYTEEKEKKEVVNVALASEENPQEKVVEESNGENIRNMLYKILVF